MRRIIDVPHEGLCDECKVVLLEGAAVRQVNFSVGVFDAVGLNLITSVRAVTLTATFVSGIGQRRNWDFRRISLVEPLAEVVSFIGVPDDLQLQHCS